MPRFEFHVINMPPGGRITNLNERLEQLVNEGWEPVVMCGDQTLNIMLRRPAPQPAAQQSAAQPAAPQAPQAPQQ